MKLCPINLFQALVCSIPQEEKSRLEGAIARLEAGEGGGATEGGEEDERMAAIRQHYQADKDKLARIKALQVRRIQLRVGVKITVGREMGRFT